MIRNSGIPRQHIPAQDAKLKSDAHAAVNRQDDTGDKLRRGRREIDRGPADVSRVAEFRHGRAADDLVLARRITLHRLA